MNVGNLTGGQVQQVLDQFIYRAIQPFVLYSDVFDAQLAYLLGHATANKKRKLSAHPREQFISILCDALMEKDRAKKFEIVSGAKIERSFVYGFVVNLLDYAKEYQSVYFQYMTCDTDADRVRLDLKLSRIENQCRMPRTHLYGAISIAESYLDLAYTFRNRIVEQYIKHARKAARNHIREHAGQFDFNDVAQNLLTAVTRAIDKYDSSRGALTSYVNFWILNAFGNSEYGHEYGTAYAVSQQQKRRMASGATTDVNFAVSLDKTHGEDTDLRDILVGDPGVDHSLEQNQQIDTIRYLAKRADTNGLARLYGDIDEVFTEKERMRMASQMQSEGLL